mgnify:CR=1 FL=1
MRQPAHDEPGRPDELLTVDGHVLAFASSAASHDETERDETPCVLRPAALDWQAAEIDPVARQHVLAERSLVHAPRRDVRELGELGPGSQRLAQAAWPPRLLDGGQ